MKKAFKFAAIAVVALALTVACKNNKTEEPADTIDSMIEAVVEDTTDSIEAVALEADEPVKPAAKADEKPTVKADNTAAASTEAAQQNAENRLRNRQVSKANMSEEQAKDAPSTEQAQKNAENRLKKR